ncbi:MAG TPA: SprT family zinc-dependent metalloprotease [Syntrophales bacterium]|nr:SprT family zinc-dependent metalloprotease [Syntrophales bacterium]
MDYTVIRSKRKTIAVEITRDGGILVRAPLRLARREVFDFVDQNRGWITRKLAHARTLQEEKTPRRFLEGESFPFLGEKHRLRYVAGGEYLRKENGDFLLGADLSARAGDLFRTWYRARAREILEERVAHFALQMGLACCTVRITDARERWGSCSAAGALNFAWRLVMAPLPVIDYVIVHELTHLVEMNHSRRFWDRLGRILPDYPARRKWLRENEHLLAL